MKLYFEAEKFLLSEKRTKGDVGGLQSMIFNDKSLKNTPKHVYALVISTLRYKSYIVEIVKKSKIRDYMKAQKVSDSLLMLLVHDLLFSARGRIESGKHPIKDSFLKHRVRLQAEFTKLKLRYKVMKARDLPTEGSDDETPIRWFRINTLKISPEEFYNTGFFKNLKEVDSTEKVAEPGLIYHDTFIPNLFGVHPKEPLVSSPLYLNGQVIIQDRASCFPVQILNSDPKGKHTAIIDACAAPGNKTTLAATFLSSDSKSSIPVVYAFERDSKRVKTLRTMCLKATGKRKRDLIQITHSDFMSTNPRDFGDVTGIIVDPSCSGSGIFGRAIEDAQMEETKQDIDTARLNKLASFQFNIVKHALSFPAARRVIYSTCSIHPHENERVVVDLLTDPQVKDQGWKLDSRSFVLSDWPRRGWKEEFSATCSHDVDPETLAGGCIRANPKEDGGIGFFAACFIRETDL